MFSVYICFGCKKLQVSGRLLNTDVMFIVKCVVGCRGLSPDFCSKDTDTLI